MLRTNRGYLRQQLRRWAVRGYLPNVVLLAATEQVEVELEPGEHAIARITPLSGEQAILASDKRLIQGAATRVRYADVLCCDWTIRHWPALQLTFELMDGQKVVLDGLGYAVFPLLKFFWFKLGRERRDNPPLQPTRAAGILSPIRKLLGRSPGG